MQIDPSPALPRSSGGRRAQRRHRRVRKLWKIIASICALPLTLWAFGEIAVKLRPGLFPYGSLKRVGVCKLADCGIPIFCNEDICQSPWRSVRVDPQLVQPKEPSPRMQQEYWGVVARDTRGVNQPDIDRFNAWFEHQMNQQQEFATNCIARQRSEEESEKIPDEGTVLPVRNGQSQVENSSGSSDGADEKPAEDGADEHVDVAVKQADGPIGMVRFKAAPGFVGGGFINLLLITQGSCRPLGREPTTRIESVLFDLKGGQVETRLSALMNNESELTSMLQLECPKLGNSGDQEECRNNLLPWHVNEKGELLFFPRSMLGLVDPEPLPLASHKRLRPMLTPEFITRMYIQGLP